jgi:peptide chain release factor 3
MTRLEDAVRRRRTFAIISHPDAGKTTLTEKLLLFGGAIQQAGAVKARGEARRAHSDWMKVERERGISVASSVMTYEFDGLIFNLLDTPGHEDFSEDTYRTLTAVDSAIMVLDSAKGIEAQTLKLFEVCRLRDVPIITFVNKLDRDGLDPFEILDDVEQRLALDVVPLSWPIGMGRQFLGCYDLLGDRLLLVSRSRDGKGQEGEACEGLDDPKLDRLLPDHALAKLREDVEMVRELCPPFDREAYLEGHLTPVFFGSAINNFGVRELLQGLADLAPPPRLQPAREREVAPTEDKVSGFIFKIQANMDPNHRDRIAFMRLCSGHFKRGMKLRHLRTGKLLNLHNPVLFLARDRELAEEAWPGDIIGIPNHGNLGALQQLAEEGVARVFKPQLGAEWIVGVVGPLQFDVLADRIRTEYAIPVSFEPTDLLTARWVEAEATQALKRFSDAHQAALASDHQGAPVFLARNAWHLDRTIKDNPEIRFEKTKEQLH